MVRTVWGIRLALSTLGVFFFFLLFFFALANTQPCPTPPRSTRFGCEAHGPRPGAYRSRRLILLPLSEQIGGLDWNTKEKGLEKAVHQILGSNVRITSIKLLVDRDTGKSKGYAFIG